MPRRVLTLTPADIARHKLDTEEGRRAFLKRRQPDDHAEWTASLHPHHKPGHQHLVLDHDDPARPLAELGPHHPGRPLVGRPMTRIACSEPGGCPNEALHGASHCEVHLQPPPGYR